VSNLCSPDLAAKMTELTPLISTLEAPKLDGASDIGVKLSEELPSTGNVMSDAGVEAPPVSLVVAGAIAEEGVCSRLIKVEESHCG
jgi:hypothetical protein